MEIRGQNGISRNFFIIFFTSFCILMLYNPMLAFATNYFSWGVENNPPNFYAYKSGTSRSTDTAHSGSYSMKLVVPGPGHDNGMGIDWYVYGPTMPFNIVGGPAIYYRWWMKIMPGFSWGSAGVNKASRVKGALAEYVYTGYLSGEGFSIAECESRATGGGCEPIIGGGDRCCEIPYNFRAKNDGIWHEYIVMVKPNSITTSHDAEFKAWVDGAQVGNFLNFRLHEVPNNQFIEAWGSWMVSPYFQLDATSADGGTIYVDDFSTDDSWNSIYTGGSDVTPPLVSNGYPSGTLPSGTTSTTMSVTTNENANCRYSSTANVAYSSMTGLFTTTGGTLHSVLLTGLTNGNSYTRYVKCEDTARNADTSDFAISFSVASSSSFNFSISNGGSKTVLQGQSATNAITSTLISGTTQSVSFSASTLAHGLTISFSPASCSPSCTTTMTVSAAQNTPTGSYDITVTGAGGGITRTTIFTLTVNIQNSSPVGCLNPPSSWIWCDDFEINRLSSYFEYNSNGGGFSRTPSAGVDGSYGMRAVFAAGGAQSSQGDLKIAFGRTPSSTFRPVDAGTANYRDIYWRMYIKTQPGWSGGGDKLSRATVMATSNWAQAAFGHVWSGDQSYLAIDPASGTDTAGNLKTTQYNDFPNMRWLGLVNSATPILDTAHSGQWNCIEAHMKLNDAGASNGIFELWINERLEAQETGMNWLGSYNAYGINTVFFENYWNSGSPVTQERYFDNLVVSTQKIGCSASSIPDTTPPTLSNGQPSGTLPSGTTSTTMSLTTNENANCKYSTTANVAYSSMTNTFTTTGGTSHSTTLTGLTNGNSYTRYVRCQDAAGNTNPNDFIVSFSVANIAYDYSLSNGGSKTITQGQSTTNTITSTLSLGTTQTVSFSSSGFPAGATSSFSPTSCNPTCTTTITINTISSTPSGNYTINVNGIGGGLTRATNFRLTVNPIITNSCSWDFFPRDIPDGKVTLGDVLVVVGDFGKTSASPGFNSKMDFNNNNQIDLFDVLTVLAHIGNCVP